MASRPTKVGRSSSLRGSAVTATSPTPLGFVPPSTTSSRGLSPGRGRPSSAGNSSLMRPGSRASGASPISTTMSARLRTSPKLAGQAPVSRIRRVLRVSASPGVVIDDAAELPRQRQRRLGAGDVGEKTADYGQSRLAEQFGSAFQRACLVGPLPLQVHRHGGAPITRRRWARKRARRGTLNEV